MNRKPAEDHAQCLMLYKASKEENDTLYMRRGKKDSEQDKHKILKTK